MLPKSIFGSRYTSVTCAEQMGAIARNNTTEANRPGTLFMPLPLGDLGGARHAVPLRQESEEQSHGHAEDPRFGRLKSELTPGPLVRHVNVRPLRDVPAPLAEAAGSDA